MGSPARQGMDLGIFVPADVRAALAAGCDRLLDVPRDGAVLEADVSGFTPLTERLAREHGPRRGAEEVAVMLDRVYSVLIAEVERAGGIVVEFAGDAILCCFDGDDGQRSLRCGLQMQGAIAALGSPGNALPEIKVTVATGCFRRFSVGDPAVRLLEVLAGPAVDRLVAASQLSERGEVVAAGETANSLASCVDVERWRSSQDVRCAVVAGVTDASGPPRAPPAPEPAVDDELARPWVAAAVYARLQAGGEELLGELRSVVALFARFTGLDYSDPDVRGKLDAYIRFAQSTIEGYGGSLLNVAVDAKGSYFCASFGAPIAHDDDPLRAAAAALALRSTPTTTVALAGLGLAAGRVYAGTYGGVTRRAFGLQGSKVNLAARLMQNADGSRILVDAPLAAHIEYRFALGARTALAVKGHAMPVTVRELAGPARNVRVSRPTPRLVDRSHERARMQELVDDLIAGRGHVVLIEGEPGIGKSRLAAHLEELAAGAGARVLTGNGDPIERGSPYHGWRAIFGSALERDVLPDVAQSSSLSGEARGEAMRDLLAGTLDAIAREQPTVVVLEDAHWLDSSSLALTLRLASTPGPLLLALTTRPLAESQRPEMPRIAELAHCVHLRLGTLSPSDSSELAALAVGRRIPPPAAALIEAKSGGNPLFTRELALTMRDRGLLERGEVARRDARIARLHSPETVEAVIAGRIDRMPSAAQSVLKVASVLGLSFSTQALEALAAREVAPEVALLVGLDVLAARGEHPEGGLAFQHAVIRDVVYERLLHAQRTELHQRTARYLEATDGTTMATLAHHWDCAEVPTRAATCLGRAGEDALRAGAARECADALQRALELIAETGPDERRARWTFLLSQAYYRLGEIERSIARGADAIAALDRPVPSGRAGAIVAILRETGRQLLHRRDSPHVPRRADGAEQRDLLAIESLFAMGEIYYAAADKARSIYVALRSLNLAERRGPSSQLAECFGAMTIISGVVGIHRRARGYADLARATAAAVDDPHAIALTTQQIAWYRSSVGPYATFCDLFPDAIDRFGALAHKPRQRDSLGCGGIGDLLFGRHAEAERKLTTLLATVEPQERAIWVQWAPLFLGALALRGGRQDVAVRRLRRAEELANPAGVDMTLFTLQALMALALWRSACEADARRYEEAAWASARRLGRLPTTHAELEGRAALAEVALARLDAAASPAARRQARRSARRANSRLAIFARVFTIGRPMHQLYRAELAGRYQRPRRALRALRRSLAAAEGLDMRHEQALAHAALADRLTPGSAAAVRHRALAVSALAAVGAPPTLRAVAPLTPLAGDASSARLAGSAQLAKLVAHWRERDSPAGYFAALLTHVEVTIAEAAERQEFDAPTRVLDLQDRLVTRCVAACRPSDGVPSAAWAIALDAARRHRGSVVEHVLLALNAHVNVDLPVALSRILAVDEPPIAQIDVERYNALAAGVIEVVVAGVAGNRRAAGVGLRAQRALAWDRAGSLATLDEADRSQAITRLDEEMAALARAATRTTGKGRLAARVGERGSIAQKITDLGVTGV